MGGVAAGLPPFVAQRAVVADILAAVQSEITLLEQQAHEKCLQLAASTASDLLTLWEDELNLPQRHEMGDEMRRKSIYLALGFFETCTVGYLKDLLSHMASGAVIDAVENHSDYSVQLNAAVSGDIIADPVYIEGALRRAIPAHIDSRLSTRCDIVGSAIHKSILHGKVKMTIRSV